MPRVYLTTNPGQTKNLGEKIAKEILKTRPGKKALVLGLEGDLGSGKTTFLQGFARGLGIKERILSPTFIILKKFKIQKPSLAKRGEAGFAELRSSHALRFVRADEAEPQRPSKFKNFYHIDCYRIKKPKEILDLGLKGIISNPQNIIAIEWADRLKKILPKDIIIIRFEFIDQNRRKITIKMHGLNPCHL